MDIFIPVRKTFIMLVKCSLTYMHRTRKTLTTQVRNFLLPLSLKVLRHKERDTHSFYSGFSICPHHLVRHPLQRPLACLRRASESHLSSSDSKTHLNSTQLTFSKSPNPSRTSGAWRHPHSAAPFPIWAIMTSLSDTSAPRTRAWTPALMLHLRNPCTKPNGSQPN